MRPLWWVLLVVSLVAVTLLALLVGTIHMSPAVALSAAFGVGDQSSVAVVQTLRVPRSLLAILVGAALGLSGAALQGALRNTLAEPYLLGVSGGAAAGAV